MRRRAATLILTALLAATATAAVPSPASAVGACVGVGVLHSGAPLFHHVIVTAPPFSPTTTVTVTPPVTAAFAAGVTVGACADVTTTPSPGVTFGNWSLTGIKSGWCGQSTGTGVTNDGHRFAWVEVGSKLLFTGDLVGFVSGYVPDVVAGQSCVTGATQFLMGWSVFAKVHCAAKSKGLTTLPIPTTSTTPFPNVNVQTGPSHYWTKVCVPNLLL